MTDQKPKPSRQEIIAWLKDIEKSALAAHELTLQDSDMAEAAIDLLASPQEVNAVEQNQARNNADVT